jgi:hypothetical protein
LIAALLCTRSIQNSSTVLRDRFSVAGAKDDRRDAYVLGAHRPALVSSPTRQRGKPNDLIWR